MSNSLGSASLAIWKTSIAAVLSGLHVGPTNGVLHRCTGFSPSSLSADRPLLFKVEVVGILVEVVALHPSPASPKRGVSGGLVCSLEVARKLDSWPLRPSPQSELSLMLLLPIFPTCPRTEGM